jgi:hypothetical protein
MEATERAISKPSDFHNKDALTQGYGRSPTTQDIEIGREQVLVSHSNAHEESLSFPSLFVFSTDKLKKNHAVLVSLKRSIRNTVPTKSKKWLELRE